MASNDAHGVDGIDVSTKLNLQCSNDSKFLYIDNVIAIKKLDDWEEEVKYLIEWDRSPEHHIQWPVGCRTKDTKSVFRKRACRYEFDSTTNMLFKRWTKDGESEALIIYITVQKSKIIFVIICVAINCVAINCDIINCVIKMCHHQLWCHQFLINICR